MSVQTLNFTLRGLFLLPCQKMFVLLQCLLREDRDLVGFVPYPMAKGSVNASCTCVERGTATIVMGSPFSFFIFIFKSISHGKKVSCNRVVEFQTL